MMTLPDWLIRLLNDIDREEARIVVGNLKNDKIINNETWDNFCEDLKKEIEQEKPNSPGEKKKSFDKICKRYCLKGPSARMPSEVKILNYIISERVFINYYLLKNRSPSTEEGSTKTLKKFRSIKLLEQREKLKQNSATMGNPNGCVWAFFPRPKKNHNDPDPIDEPQVLDRADLLRKALGLQCTVPEGASLLCLRYSVKKAKRKKIPLAISAGFNRCFKPSDDPKTPYGWTYNIESKKKGFPEIVHENLSAEFISFKVRFISFARND